MVNGDDEGEEADKEKGGTRNLRWADCEEEEGVRQGAGGRVARVRGRAGHCVVGWQ